MSRLTLDLNLPISYKHSGDIGDLIYSLCILKYHGQGPLYLNAAQIGKKIDGSRSGFTPGAVDALKPLLESQEYVSEVKFWSNEEVRYDIDLIRKMHIDYSKVNICDNYCKIFMVPPPLTRKAWIEVTPNKVKPVVFARSMRYHNKDMKWHEFVNKHAQDAIFVGFEGEHEAFTKAYGHIPFHKTEDLLELARVIAGAELFIGNQSAPMSLAIAINSPHQQIVQEVCSLCPNCIFPRSNITYIREAAPPSAPRSRARRTIVAQFQ